MKQQGSHIKTVIFRGLLWITVLFLLLDPKIGLAQSFVHPGGLHTLADLNRMKVQVSKGAHPWIDGWNQLVKDPKAQSTYLAAPSANMGVSRQRADADAHAAYLNTLRWYISGDTAYAACAVKICNDWSRAVNQVPSGTDIPGLSGIPIFDFALAGELLRTYPGWAPGDFNQFKHMMLTYFYPVCSVFLHDHRGTCDSHYWANWDACNIGAILTIGVLCDDTIKYNEAVNYFKTGNGNGAITHAVPILYSGNIGQWQESGRDQEHAQLGVGLLASACQVAWNQGLDLFGYENNRLLAGAEYVARTNLSQPVPYTSYNNCDNVNQYYLSPGGQIGDRPVYELLYNHYVVLRKLSAPNVKAMAALQRPEHGSIDHFGYGTLTFTLDAATSPYPAFGLAEAPSNLKAVSGVGQVSLQWDASRLNTAQGYTILRATVSRGPYLPIASWNANTNPRYTDRKVVNGSNYYYIIRASNQSGLGAASAEVVAKPVSAGLLPSVWQTKDIGGTPVSGNSAYASINHGTFLLSSAGDGIGGKADRFSFTCTSVSGDMEMTARLVSTGGALGKAGIMVRASLEPDAAAVFMKKGDVGGRIAGFGYRPKNAVMSFKDGNQYTFGVVWFKIKRSGDRFTGYQSADGLTWYQVSSNEISMAQQCYIGMAICSGRSGALTDAYFDNVEIKAESEKN